MDVLDLMVMLLIVPWFIIALAVICAVVIGNRGKDKDDFVG